VMLNERPQPHLANRERLKDTRHLPSRNGWRPVRDRTPFISVRAQAEHDYKEGEQMTDKKQDDQREKEKRYNELKKKFQEFEKQDNDGGGYQF